MKRHILYGTLVFLLLATHPVFPFESEGPPTVGVFVSAGIGRSSIDGWNLDFELVGIEVPAEIFVSGGLVFGPLPLASSTQFYISGEFGKFDSSGTEYNPDLLTSGKVELQRTPAMAWFTMANKGKFGPLFRVGIGASYLRFSETYDPDRSADVELEYWTFGFGFGGGLFFDVSDQFGVWLNVDGVLDTKTKKETRRMSGIETGLSGLNGYASFSVRAVLWL